ncbi:MAG: energy-coupling factor ABC transporter ATP-binding protein [Halocynthiibacter sp.]
MTRLSNVSYQKNGRDILTGISLELTEPRIGVVGRNGSGKTTLARLIAGLVAPTRGEIRVLGIDVARDRARAIGVVGILFQNPDHQIIFPTVEEEISFGLSQLGADKRAARQGAHRVLARFGKDSWAERSIHTLSQGQRHLVCLMSVLAMEPRLIVLDEPFAGLDIPTARALNRYLDGLGQQLLHITHETATLEQYDRVLWIDDGKLRLDGSAEFVLTAFHSAMNETAEENNDLADFAR